MLNTEFDAEYIFDANDYLIKNYPKMTLAVRRSVCLIMHDYIDEEAIEQAVDAAVADYALKKLDIEKKVEDEDEEA